MTKRSLLETNDSVYAAGRRHLDARLQAPGAIGRAVQAGTVDQHLQAVLPSPRLRRLEMATAARAVKRPFGHTAVHGAEKYVLGPGIANLAGAN